MWSFKAQVIKAEYEHFEVRIMNKEQPTV